MAPSIRARLTIWYSLVMLVVLAVTAGVLAAVHLRLGLNRIDRQLSANLVTVAVGVQRELDQGFDLRAAVADAFDELEIPGSGIAVLNERGDLLGTRVNDVAALPVDVLVKAGEAAATLPTTPGGIRLRSAGHTHRGQPFRIVVWISLVPFSSERSTLLRTLWVAFPIALVLATTGGWILGWRGLSPLTEMARQVNQIDDRRLEARLSVHDTRDELSALGTAFNTLLDRLARALQAQRRFMADASHQLRTPLSIARTAAQVTLGREDRTSREYRESLAIIAEQTDRLTRMVNDMFTLALADVDARPLQLGEFYVDEVVHDCVRAAGVLAAERGITVRPCTPEDVQLCGDEGLIRQMVLNLIENAIRHTPVGGTVDVGVSTADDRVRVEVSDTGPGIPEADRERIFERFVRVEAGSDGGGGLGLPIARWIAELHQGRLALESTGTAGSRFVATLPLRPPREPVPPT